MTEKEIYEGLSWEVFPKPKIGGQHCGVISKGVTLIHEELEFKMSVNGFRNSIEAKQFLLSTFENYLKEINK